MVVCTGLDCNRIAGSTVIYTISFKVGTDGSYQRQNGIMLFYLCMIYFYLMGEVFLVRFRKRLSFELLFSTTVFAVVSVFTLVLHIAFPGFRFQFLEWQCAYFYI